MRKEGTASYEKGIKASTAAGLVVVEVMEA